jgi:hypothetical protein
LAFVVSGLYQGKKSLGGTCDEGKETVQMAEAFGIKSGKNPELWAIKA